MANYENHLPLHQTLKDICGMRIRKDIGLLSCLFGKKLIQVSLVRFLFFGREEYRCKVLKLKKTSHEELVQLLSSVTQ